MEANKCWSADEENFNYEDLGELLDSCDELVPGDTVYEGDAIPPNPARLCTAIDVLDVIDNRAYEIGGEHADGCASVSAEAEAELNVLLAAWIQKHCHLNFWQVRNIKPYVLTADDFPDAEAA